MRFDVLTLFPESMDRLLSESIIGRARDAGFIQIETINIRDYTENKHKKVDDYPYGGGTGMVMTPQPIYSAWQAVMQPLAHLEKKPYTVYMSPQGNVLNQVTAMHLAEKENLIILCGHYEGVDERILEEIVDEEISIGDYVLTGGELPAMVLIDCVSRLVPGVLPSPDAYSEETHYSGLIEYPQYTRPDVFMERNVPDILLSGHHEHIKKWRFLQMLERTKKKRPDMFERYDANNPLAVLEAYGLLPKKKNRKK